MLGIVLVLGFQEQTRKSPCLQDLIFLFTQLSFMVCLLATAWYDPQISCPLS